MRSASWEHALTIATQSYTVHQRRRLPSCNVCRTRWLMRCSSNRDELTWSPFCGHFTGCLSNIGWLTSWPFLRSTCDSRRHRCTWTVSSLTESLHLECHSGRRLVPWWQSQGLTLFSVCAPVVWNSLPPEIQWCSYLKIFKSKLKTFLFRRAFNIWPVAKRLCILGLHGAI